MSAPRKKRKPFVIQQLEASGLTIKDVQAKVTLPEDDKPALMSPFRSGGIDRGPNGKDWIVNTTDDEMLIFYYDRFGNPRKYATKGAAGRLKDYVRIRWSNPEAHQIAERPVKYQSPPKSESIVYIPQKVREIFLSGEKLETLFIQEGEKKAEKACKHGIISVAIQGIWNIGNRQTGVDKELQYLIQELEVKNVVMIMDSDFDHLSSNLSAGDEITTRPESFAGAIIKFRKYIRSLKNVDVDAEIFFAHIKENENGDKGLDDLLVNTLKGRESDLKKDIEKAMHSIDGQGEFVEAICISSFSETKIKDLWGLSDKDAFIAKYREKLLALKSFKFHRIPYEAVNGEIVCSAKYEIGESLWETEENDKGRISVRCDYYKFIKFLEKCGFSKYRLPGIEAEYALMQEENGIVSRENGASIREFIWLYIQQSTKSPAVLNYFYQAIDKDFSDSKLLRLKTEEVICKEFENERQYFYFKNCQVRVSAKDITVETLMGPVWKDNVIDRSFRRVPVIGKILNAGDYCFKVFGTDSADECEFFQFLQKTSTIIRNEEEAQGLSEEDILNEFMHHLVNKLTSIGYMLCSDKRMAEAIAVVAEDYTVSEGGNACGGTGKSLIGKAIRQMCKTTPIDGKKNLNEDNFIFSTVSKDTRAVLMDDIQKGFRFSTLYPAITSDLEINPKGGQRYSIPFEESPKIYLSTNYAIKDENDSSERRINYIILSNFFTKDNTPFMLFKHELFKEWDEEQWNLFDNLMLECVMYYLQSLEQHWHKVEGRGAIPPPMGIVERKKYAALVSLPFLEWADVYYHPSSGHLNRKELRKTVFDDLAASYGDASSISAATFKKNLTYYCQYRGLDLNRHRPEKDSGESYEDFHKAYPDRSFIGDRDVSGGKEFFIVSTPGAEIDIF